MTHKSFSIITAILLTVAFCTFILVYEKLSMDRAQSRIETHARIIEDAMWNYNHQGIAEYLKLAAFSDRYSSLTVVHHNGEEFQAITQEPASRMDRLLIAMHLMPQVHLKAQVVHQEDIIGQVRAIWLPATLYTHTNVFVAMVMIFVIIQLYIRVLKAKGRLEERVMERTAELVDSNVELKQEIEERSRAEEALRASEEKHRLLSENISDVIWTMDLELNYTYISPAASNLHGWPPEELNRLTNSDILTPESLEKTQILFGKELAKGHRLGNYKRTITTELDMFCIDGGTKNCEVTASIMVDDDGHPRGILGVTRDITERRRAETEKAELQRQLERSKKMESLGLLAGGVAHDLNNVLSGIVSYPDLLLMDLPAESPLRAPIKTIKTSGQKAATIVQDLLTLARRGVNTSEVLNLNDLIIEHQRSAEYQELLVHYPVLEIDFKLDENLPNIKGSSVHLHKTVMNLMANAAEALVGNGRIEITTDSLYMDRVIRGYDTVNTGEYVHLRVHDNGPGIDRSDIDHIFEPFYTKKKMGRSGTGLGLAVVWGTVQDHDGYIDVNSAAGQGTTFDLYFPLSREVIPAKEQHIDLKSVQGDGESVLVVDDMESQRIIAADLLQRLNYTPHTVESGEAAVAYLADHTVDLVVLDMIMEPGMDGLETWQQIIKRHPRQRSIIASGYAETDKVKSAQRLGAGEYLRKPYMIHTLGEALQRALAADDAHPDNRN